MSCTNDRSPFVHHSCKPGCTNDAGALREKGIRAKRTNNPSPIRAPFVQTGGDQPGGSQAEDAEMAPADLRERRRLQRREQRRRALRRQEGERHLRHFFTPEETIADLVTENLIPLSVVDDDEALAEQLAAVLAEAPELIRENRRLETVVAGLAEYVEELARRCEHRRPGRWCGQLDCVCKRAVYVARGPLE